MIITESKFYLKEASGQRITPQTIDDFFLSLNAAWYCTNSEDYEDDYGDISLKGSPKGMLYSCDNADTWGIEYLGNNKWELDIDVEYLDMEYEDAIRIIDNFISKYNLKYTKDRRNFYHIKIQCTLDNNLKKMLNELSKKLPYAD